ncbi:GRM1 (predicted) [Pycnogonum litorale]
MWISLLSLILTAVAAVECTSQRKTAVIPGDLVIGALFSVHNTPEARSAHTRVCGTVREQYGIQRVEASFMTIDAINNDPKILPNIKLGVEIRDSCWYSPIALEQSIEFIRDTLASVDEIVSLHNASSSTIVHPPGVSVVYQRIFLNGTVYGPAQQCPSTTHAQKKSKNLIGVIGPGSSTVTIQVQNLLQLFNIAQVGYSATSRDLSEKNFYKYFLRVVPSDYYQAQVMVDLVRRYNWTYILAVYTDGNYGGSGMDAFSDLASLAGICIAVKDSVLSNAKDEDFDTVIEKLLLYPKAKVIVCFCEGMTLRRLLIATERLGVAGQFLIIGSDGWADRYEIVEGHEKAAIGGLSIRIHSNYEKSFDNYYFGLNPRKNKRNPWFQEFWQHRFNCSLNPSVPSKYNRTCTGRELLNDGKYTQDSKMAFVMKAIYTMAYGLHDMQQDLCKGKIGLCPAMLPINGSIYLQYLMNVTFQWREEELVEFDSQGDPPGWYDIMNFQQENDTNFKYTTIGSWKTGKLELLREIQWNPSFGSSVPESVCSRACPKGQKKNIHTDVAKCCWTCVACKDNQYLPNDTTCMDCDLGWWPNENLTDCYRIDVEHMKWGDTQAVVSMTLAILGFVCTLFAMVVFVQHNNTPVVKASTRELSYIIMVGMYLCYLTTFVLLTKPTMVSCYITRILPGLSFSMIYAALVTKTNRIARILAGSKKKIITKKPRFMSATAQVVITCLLILIEVGIIVFMLLWEPPDWKYHHPALNRVVLICNTTPLGVIAPMGFDFFLIIMCTLYALKTRNVPENFNEAKFIGFTMYTTCVIWIAFLPIYFGSDTKVITMCLCVSLSAIVTLVLLFLPKIYIILLRPERNNRSAFTTSKSVRCHIGSHVNSALSRTSTSFSTSDHSMESPKNHSVDVLLKQKHAAQKRKRSLFERFRIHRGRKEEKHAKMIADHIRAVKAAEDLDRRSHVRRSHSDHLSMLHKPSREVVGGRGGSGAGERDSSSPLLERKRQLANMLKNEYGQETSYMPGFDELEADDLYEPEKEDVGCQTSREMFQEWMREKKRVARSETMTIPLSPDSDMDLPSPPPEYSDVLLTKQQQQCDGKSRCNTHSMPSSGGNLIKLGGSNNEHKKRTTSTTTTTTMTPSVKMRGAGNAQSLKPAKIVEESASCYSDDSSSSGDYRKIVIDFGTKKPKK